jgi:aryl-alcohol dehydrogenase-like predicted oxidoreductase
MESRRLGSKGPIVKALGLGCMGMSEFYGEADEGECRRILNLALDMGMMLDSADCYGAGRNEELIGAVLRERGVAKQSFVATKFGIRRRPGEYARTIDNSAAYIRSSVEGSLRRLGREWIDLYYVHRLDSRVAIEETVATMADLAREGKIRYLGLSEVSAETLRRANAVHPIAAVQSEYSLFTRGVEERLVPALEECGTGLVAYSPLGRGFLTGRLDRERITAAGDFRSSLPRMNGENFERNRALVAKLERIAEGLGQKPAAVALAWLISKYDFVVPIPGTKRERYFLENASAAEIILTEETRAELEREFFPGAAVGERYTEEGMVGIEN